MLAIEEKEEDIMEEDWYVTHGVGHRGKRGGGHYGGEEGEGLVRDSRLLTIEENEEEDLMEEEEDWYVSHSCWP